MACAYNVSDTYGTKVVVKVTCKAGDKKIVAYRLTKINGTYNITIEAFNYKKQGGKACKAKFHMAPKGSQCNIPITFHGGNKGAFVKVKIKTHHEVVLMANPFVRPRICLLRIVNCV